MDNIVRETKDREEWKVVLTIFETLANKSTPNCIGEKYRKTVEYSGARQGGSSLPCLCMQEPKFPLPPKNKYIKRPWGGGVGELYYHRGV